MANLTLQEKIKIALEKGYNCDFKTGEVFGPTGNRLTIINDGYRKFSIWHNSKNNWIKFHQFIFYCANGYTVDCIDHINQNKLDNRLCNLRSVDKMENMYNSNKSNGYYFDKSRNKYISKIQFNKKSIFIGRFNTEDEAKEAYLNAKKIYHNINA